MDFRQQMLTPLQAALTPLMLADAPGAVARGMISGQSLPEAFGSVMTDPTSAEGRVYGEDISGDPLSGFLLELLTDPGLLMGLGAGGLGATLLRGAGKRGPWKGISRKAISPRHRQQRFGMGRERGSPTTHDDSLALLLEKLVREAEPDYPGRVPGIEPEYSSLIGEPSRLLPESNLGIFRTIRGARDPHMTTRFGSTFRGTFPSEASPFGSDLTLNQLRRKGRDIRRSWSIPEVEDIISIAKAGDSPERKEALELLRSLFGNGFGTGGNYSGITSATGRGVKNVGEVRKVLSLRKEINTILYDEGFIDKPMSIHQAVLQEDPQGSIFYGGGSRKVIQQLSPPTLFAHTIKDMGGMSSEELKLLLKRMEREISEASRIRELGGSRAGGRHGF